MTCEELRGLEELYAAGACTPDEVAAIEAHLQDCSLHGDLIELRAAVLLLDVTVAEAAPPASLGTRVAAIASPPGSNHDQPAGRTWLSWPLGVAAAALLVAIGLGAWNFVLLSDDDDGETLFTHTIHVPDGPFLAVIAEDGANDFALEASNLAQLESGQTYQFWVIRDRVWLRVGNFDANPEGSWSGEFDFALEPDDLVCLTVEPQGGSDTPTGDPIVISPLQPQS